MLSDAQIDRWSRQILLPDVGGRGQLRLLGARVGLVGDGRVAAQCVDLLRRAGVPVTAGVVPDDAEVFVDLAADTDAGVALARRAVAAGAPLVRGRIAGAAATVDTLTGRPCGCCATAGQPVPARGANALAIPAAQALAIPAAQALAALVAAEVLGVLLAPPRHGRRQRIDLAAGDFWSAALAGPACEVCDECGARP